MTGLWDRNRDLRLCGRPLVQCWSRNGDLGSVKSGGCRKLSANDAPAYAAGIEFVGAWRDGTHSLSAGRPAQSGKHDLRAQPIFMERPFTGVIGARPRLLTKCRSEAHSAWQARIPLHTVRRGTHRTPTHQRFGWGVRAIYFAHRQWSGNDGSLPLASFLGMYVKIPPFADSSCACVRPTDVDNTASVRSAPLKSVPAKLA